MTSRSIPAGIARPAAAHGFAESRGKPLLAIETGSRSCSVAILFGDMNPPPIRLHEDTDHGQATMLMPMIEQVIRESGCAYGDLERIAVAVGPGSFTGLRVGIAAAQGLALASDVPLIGISSFQAVGAGHLSTPNERNFRCFVLLDSRREEPFFAELDARDNFTSPPTFKSVAEIDALLASAGPSLVFGDAPAIYRGPKHFPPSARLVPTRPDALLVALLAADPARRYDLPPKPVYIRPPDVTVSKPA